MANLLVYSSTCLLVYLKKYFFSFFTLTPSLFRWNALFIGVSSVRVSVRVELLPSHYSHTILTLHSHYSHTPLTLPAGKLLVGDSMDGVKLWFSGVWAVVYRQYSYAALLVQVCCHCWCTYAAPLVFLCWTNSIPMLNHRYFYAGPSVPECFTLLVPFFYFIYSQYFSNPYIKHVYIQH